jgi:hypothetical protein
MMRINRRTFAAGSAAIALAPRIAGAQDKKLLRFVQNGNLTILDPIWTTAYVTRDHGYMIYDVCSRPTPRRDQAADGRQVRGLGRQDAVDLHPARRAGVA